MAKKKPPQAPPPSPLDDFDPDKILGEEIKPIEDEIIEPDAVDAIEPESVSIESVSDEIVEPDEVAPEEVAPEEVVAEEPDLFGGLIMTPDEPVEPATTKSAATQIATPEQLEEPLDEVVDSGEVSAEESVVIDESEVVAGDELVAEDEEESEDGQFAMEDASDDDHEAATLGETGALSDEDVEGDEGDEDLVPAGGIDDEDEPYQEEEIPQPRTHWFTWTLIAFNLIGALAAPYVLAMAFAKRQEYTYAVIRTELIAQGLPNEEEKDAMTAARTTLPALRISGEEVKRIMNERLAAASTSKNPISQVSDNVKDLEEHYGKRVPPEYLTKELLKEHFGYFGVPYTEPIKTVEDEMRRLQNAVGPAIKDAVDDSLKSVKGDPAKQRIRIEKLLLPLAADVYQVEKLTKRLNEAKGEELEAMYRDAVTLRIAFDFLLPLELFRPGESKEMFLHSFGDLGKQPDKIVDGQRRPMSAERALERIEQRLKSSYGENYVPALHFDHYDNGETLAWDKMKRTTIEKRLTETFTMIALAHVKKPSGEELFPDLMKRIPLVVGQYDFALACELFPIGLLAVNERVLERIAIDREGPTVFQRDAQKELVKDDKGNPVLLRNKRFIDYYEDELDKIRMLQYDVFKAKIRVADLEKQKKRYEELLVERKEQRVDVLKKIAAARAKTAKNVAELRVFQNELFRYELKLATSEEELAVLYREIAQRLGGPNAAKKEARP